MQQFYETTLESKFIKHLLSITPLPMVSYLQDNDIMLKDSYYIYLNRILQCKSTGVFRGGRADTYEHLTVGNLIYCQDPHSTDLESSAECSDTCEECLKVTDSLILHGGKRMASYSIISDYTFGKYIPGITEMFTSNKSYYDEETHKRLGDYLRLIYATQGVDLMPLYNCFCNKFVSNVNICNGVLEDITDERYKVTLVPVKFNRTYTIAIDCASPIYIKPVIYKNNLIHDSSGSFILNETYSAIQKISCCTYKQPFTYKVLNCDPSVQVHESSLYLAIQIPKSNRSAITVIEGVRSNYNFDKIFDAKMYDNADYSVINHTLTSSLSLLRNNPSYQHTYSDKLISYLLQNTIDDRETIGNNVTRVQKKLKWLPQYPGYWDEELRARLYDRYMNLRKTRDELNYDDILGYVDVDIENSLNRGYMTPHDK